MKIAIINGPNMNLLGKREPEHYGRSSLTRIEANLTALAKILNCEVFFYQSNSESGITNFIQSHLDRMDGIIINPAALTAVGYSIIDAIKSVDIPFIEVHMTNIYARGSDHECSIFSKHGIGVITGIGAGSYEAALKGLVDFLKEERIRCDKSY